MPLIALGQYIRLTPSVAASALYLNGDRVFNYNRYDGVHLEGSFYYAFPNENGKDSPTSPQWQIAAFAGYGGLSRYYSYGGSVALQDRATSHRWRPSIAYSHELEQAGRVALQEYNLLTPDQNAVYMADRFSAVDQVTLGLSGRLNVRSTFSLCLRQSIERQLFATNGALLYGEAVNTPFYRYSEAHLRISHNGSLTLDAVGGITDYDWQTAYLRAIVQYNHSRRLGKSLSTRLFVQGGYASEGTPYSRLFDISGTCGSHYFFSNTLLTVRPNEFHAHLYARATLTVATAKPLWNASISAPVPFVQVGALCGWLVQGGKLKAHATVGGMWLNAPTEGLLEPAVGITNLLRWSRISLGVAAAYRLTPADAYYAIADPEKNLAFMFTASIN